MHPLRRGARRMTAPRPRGRLRRRGRRGAARWPTGCRTCSTRAAACCCWLLLVPPLLWFGVIYLGSLFALLANAFFGLDDFTGQVVRELTLEQLHRALPTPANLDVALRSITMAMLVTLACIVLGFPVAYYMARHARGTQKALLYVAVMLPLWSSYLVRLYAWKLLLAKEGAISWLAQHAAPARGCSTRCSRRR